MKGRTKVVLAAVIVVIALISIGVYYITTAGGEIPIGMVAPISGTFAEAGKWAVNGAQLAVEELNASGGVLGKQLRLVVQDEGQSTDTAISATQMLVQQEGVKFLIGPYWSGDVAAVLPLTSQNKIIQILTVSSLDALMVPPQNTYLFRVTLPDSGYAKAIVEWLKLIGAQKYAYLAEDYKYAHEVGDFSKKFASEAGIQCVFEGYYPGTATDYTVPINQVVAAKPDATVVIMEGTNGIDFQKQYSMNKEASKIPVLHFETLLIDSRQASSVEAANPGGMNYVFVGVTSTMTNRDAVKSFADKLKNKYGIDYNHYSADAYDGVMVLAQAIKRAGSLEPDAVANALMKTDWSGVGGRRAFESNHNPKVGLEYICGTVYQVFVEGGAIKYKVVWPPSIAEASPINPATGTVFKK
jgi:branched-chain amino acid transport system substrate-binding protein